MKALDTVKKPVGKHSENFKGLYINVQLGSLFYYEKPEAEGY